MKFTIITLTIAGMGIIFCSMIKYIKSLKVIKIQNYQKYLFPHWIYIASFFMMIFFFLSYFVVIINFMGEKLDISDLIISFIFFFGSLFVLTMVIVQKNISHDLLEKKLEVITALIGTVETKDQYTQGHSYHVSRLVELFYEKLPSEYKEIIDKARLLDASLLHDIGKIFVPDSILNKPGKLTEDEYKEMQMHPLNGKKILDQTSYKTISNWILYHHERIDGNGYYKLKGDEIPIESKIIAIADAFSALYTDRIYRKKMQFEEVHQIFNEAKGVIFDAKLVDIFFSIEQEKFDNIEPVHTILNEKEI